LTARSEGAVEYGCDRPSPACPFGIGALDGAMGSAGRMGVVCSLFRRRVRVPRFGFSAPVSMGRGVGRERPVPLELDGAEVGSGYPGVIYGGCGGWTSSSPSTNSAGASNAIASGSGVAPILGLKERPLSCRGLSSAGCFPTIESKFLEIYAHRSSRKSSHLYRPRSIRHCSFRGPLMLCSVCRCCSLRRRSCRMKSSSP
jgi:hypothetical protein